MVAPTNLSRKQTGFRLPQGEWFNTIIDRLNGLMRGTLDGIWSGTFNGALGGTTPAAVSATTLAATGAQSLSGQVALTTVPQALAAAGANQGAAAAITGNVVMVSTTTSAEGVILPAWVAGANVLVFAPLALNVNVYPPVGSQIGVAATNAAVVLAAAKASRYVADAATNVWRAQTGA